MFVPCDELGNVLEEPNNFYDKDLSNEEITYLKSLHKEYEIANSRVIFKGFAFKPAITEKYFDILKHSDGNVLYPKLWRNKTIEYLVKYNLELTPTAIKEIYGETGMY